MGKLSFVGLGEKRIGVNGRTAHLLITGEVVNLKGRSLNGHETLE